MEATEQIKKFQEFFELNYKAQLLEKISKGEKYFIVNFVELSKFDPDLADILLEQPEEVIKAAELAIETEYLENEKNFKVRFYNLPESQRILVRNIRSSHIGKLLQINGIVRQKSDVRPQVISAKFECPSCGNIINILQIDSKFKEPTRCGCGRKGKFKLIDKELVDAQRIILEEAPEDLEGGEQPKRMGIFLKYDLVSPMSEKKTNPGVKINITGYVKEVPIISRTGGQSTRFDLMVDCNCVESVEEEYLDITVNKKEEKKILKLSKDSKLYEKMVNSVSPTIYGHNKIKEALILQLFGGIQKKKSGVMTRGDIHMLLIGDPGAAKSQILKRINNVAPKGRYVSGKGVSGAGLTASVVRDEFLRGWALEAGALVLANKGLCCTTEDTEFITEDYKKITFKELFKNTNNKFIYPKFKILALNIENNKIEAFKIKKAFKIKNKKKIFKIKTRTGREINLTEENEILIIKNSKEKWVKTENLTTKDFIAVPNKFPLERKDNYSKEFAYVCGLIASDGHVKINNKNAQTSFYNTNLQLVSIFKKNLENLKIKYSTYIQKKGRKSIIRGKKIISKKDLYKIYNSKKDFAKKLINFGIPNGNKSNKSSLNKKTLSYSNKTLASFIKGIFDGDGSIRKNPIEITLKTGLIENAKLYQEIFLRFGIISSIKKSTNSWHCDIRGTNECIKFFNLIGTSHPIKFERFSKIKSIEVKDRINTLPNHQEFFKHIIKKNRWKLGKNIYKYIWNYTRNNVCPQKYKLKILNKLIQDEKLANKINNDILWDKIISIKKINAKYVYDFTMDSTNNFIANNVIMHNCIDEMDKMSEEDRSAMHEALEQQSVSISKANIQATLVAQTTVLAAANPKLGRFDPSGNIAEQINLPPTLINRFDLIFPIMDLPDKTKDEKMAKFILNLHQNVDIEEPEIDTKFLRKYIAYAKQKISPKLTDAASEEIKRYYVEMRNKEVDEKSRRVPISPRQLEALVRLAEAYARIRLSSKVLKKDAKKAVDMLSYCLNLIGIDPETGKIDIDRITTGISATERSKIVTVKEIIRELEEKIGKVIPIDDIIREAKEQGLDEDKVEESIEKLKRSGDLFSPRPNFLSRI